MSVTKRRYGSRNRKAVDRSGNGSARRAAALGRKSKQAAAENGRVMGTTDDPRQTYIEGTEPPVIPELTESVAEYIKLRKQQAAIKQQADEARTKIRSQMEEQKLDSYVCSLGDVRLEHGVTVVKVKPAREK